MKRNNLLGRKFGRLTVIAEAEPRVYESGRKIRWKCLCECGNYVIVDGSNLCTGHTRSCGCLLIESSSRIGSDKEIRKKINATKASKPKVKRSYRQSYTVALENGTLVDDSYCVETDTIFKSVSFAGRQLALSQSNISRSCKTGCVCGGFHWEYV